MKKLNNTILIALEEPLIVKGLKFSLEQQGYKVDTVYNKNEVLKKAKTNQYILVIIDISSPDVNGFNVYQTIREKCNIPVIIVANNAYELDKVIGIEGGQYDYVTKPINIVEFISKVNASVIKAKGKNYSVSGIIKLWDLTIDTLSRSISAGNRVVELTSKEYEILLLLAQNRNRVYSREDLLHAIWGFGYNGDKRIVDVHIRRLREKIESDPSNPLYIITKWGTGYYFNG